jgi:hypothetical protein
MTPNPDELVSCDLGDSDSDTEEHITQPEPESNMDSDSRFTEAVCQADHKEIGKKLTMVHKMDRSQRQIKFSDYDKLTEKDIYRHKLHLKFNKIKKKTENQIQELSKDSPKSSGCCASRPQV